MISYIKTLMYFRSLVLPILNDLAAVSNIASQHKLVLTCTRRMVFQIGFNLYLREATEFDINFTSWTISLIRINCSR